LRLIKLCFGTDLGHDGSLSTTRLATEDERLVTAGHDQVLLVLLLVVVVVVDVIRSDVVVDESEDVIATLELS